MPQYTRPDLRLSYNIRVYIVYCGAEDTNTSIDHKRVFFFTIEGDTGNTDGLGRNVNQDERSMCARQKAGTPESKCRGEKTTIEMGLLVYEIVFSNREIFQHNRSLMPIRQQELISYVRDGES